MRIAKLRFRVCFKNNVKAGAKLKIAIIPARGGSKRIPRKNIKNFCGKPIIAYSISAAKESGVFDKIIVSTDDPEIAEIAGKLGAEVPYIRATDIADDITPIKDVMRDAISWYRKNNLPVSYICCVYATAPFVEAAAINQGWQAIKSDENTNFAISVAKFSYPIQRALKIKQDGKLAMAQPEHNLTRSQDLEPMYHDAAQFFWARSDAMMKYDAIFDSGCCPIIVPTYRVQDIDNEEDWVEAELKFSMLHDKSKNF